MKKAILILILFTSLNAEDISKVMDRLFKYHIENKEFDSKIVKRAFYIYLKQFDPAKIYLLKDEVAPFVKLDEERAKEIAERFKKGDYLEFLSLNTLFEKAIKRSRKIRAAIEDKIVEEGLDFKIDQIEKVDRFSLTEEELKARQVRKIMKFLILQDKRSNLNTKERIKKAFLLLEKRQRIFEDKYLPKKNMSLKDKISFLSVSIVKAFAKSLDSHTTYFSDEEAFELRTMLEKKFHGVGVVLAEGVDGIIVIDLIKGSPAERSSKIERNDVLLTIDGRSIKDWSFEQVLGTLKEKEELNLEFKRKDESYSIKLKKQALTMEEDRLSYSYENFGDGVIGKLTLNSFYENEDGISSARDLKRALRDLKRVGNLQGLILDLRSNGGGFLSQAVKVVSLFIENGIVVVSKYSTGEKVFFRSVNGKSYFDGPLVILTSKFSASASEIVAQALNDYGIALIVGDKRTFGKGSIQYQTVTNEQSDIFFKVTVGKYYTVSGKSTQIKGVRSDILVPGRFYNYKIGEKYLDYPLSQDEMTSCYQDPLVDLDPKTKRIFEISYLPFLQNVVTTWRDKISILRDNSRLRMSKNESYQLFLREGKADSNIEELQMQEAVDIVKDMIILRRS